MSKPAPSMTDDTDHALVHQIIVRNKAAIEKTKARMLSLEQRRQRAVTLAEMLERQLRMERVLIDSLIHETQELARRYHASRSKA